MGAFDAHRSNMIRRAAVALVMLAPGLSLAAKPAPDHAPKTGLIVASSMFLVATPFDSAVTLAAAMTRLQQPQPVTASCGGAWRVHFAVQLERPSGEETLELSRKSTCEIGWSLSASQRRLAKICIEPRKRHFAMQGRLRFWSSR